MITCCVFSKKKFLGQTLARIEAGRVGGSTLFVLCLTEKNIIRIIRTTWSPDKRQLLLENAAYLLNMDWKVGWQVATKKRWKLYVMVGTPKVHSFAVKSLQRLMTAGNEMCPWKIFVAKVKADSTAAGRWVTNNAHPVCERKGGGDN